MAEQKRPLTGMTLTELEAVVKEGGMPRFVAKQLAQWLYEKRVTDFEQMNNISGKNKQWLSTYYCVGRTSPATALKSSDGTVKYMFDYGEGKKVESVYIPDKDRATLCVSSQAGCRMNCYFCMTGKQGFKGNLTAVQIMNQILSIPPEPKKGEEPLHPLTNVVFMGMGEPLDNLGELLKVLEIITAPWGLAWSPKRVTVSTVGKLTELKELLDKTQVHIAVSVHSADPEQRRSMMPAERAYPIRNVMQLLQGYDFSHQRRLSLEYIMWRNVNDDIQHANMLAALTGKLECRVNLIRFHKIPGVELVPSSEEKMIIFRNILNSKGIICTIRASRGEDIMAACGMLAGKGKAVVE
ncbi:MAG: 23S rRNA (adenine(2503)-C(2))-methyltransferase RlmN [Lachnospiraceae bacterium]|nr:23S rRNA (adenine(2503)-C(2))-methyltransferase RlmN [Prevotella sp.]MCM1074348.1 23S rRNA (adenine(2503)-C(2))-methyltransferase RlmN [Ruminococcus sp.]MCM1222480.1 23S rRNA (adenine(2503)-C(2))-methyltransferase RlmN [Lachnospiraceae bacterium]